ncbi:MAG: SWF/SNF helicase family protein [Candidatus Cloacimonetes bacterium]|nr:SWF/SNF helicase family protein [Candidatus Cloacimonadota bacterium]
MNEFESNENIRLFLISLKTGGTGLNLTAADTVILYDPWWNPMVENQAIDRTHRLGQTRKVQVFSLDHQKTRWKRRSWACKRARSISSTK